MKNKSLYDKTVDILYQAYFNDTLKHLSCTACAVGNICGGNLEWRFLFVTEFGTQRNVIDVHYLTTSVAPFNSQLEVDKARKRAFDLIESTGYTPYELAKVEYAFESADKGKSGEDWMFNGLVAVLDVLKEIHEVKDDVEVRTKFKKHHQTKLQCQPS